jgi:betaine reductase
MSKKIQVMHYLNQFFAQIGGEERGDTRPGFIAGAVGPGRALQQALAVDGEVVGTIYCGDNYFAEQEESVLAELVALVADQKADLLVAGPAFESGRYGVACGAICKAAQRRLGIAAVAGMDENNAGASLYQKDVYIVNSGPSVARMNAALQRMAVLGLKLVHGTPVGKPEEEGFLPRGIKRNAIAAKPPAQRAVDMLLAKLRGEAIQPEILPPRFSSAKPARPLKAPESALIALVTDGGLVVEGNPENMEPGRPTRFTSISIADVQSLDADAYDVVHSGYDTTLANRDPNRLVPLDIMRQLEEEGAVGKVYDIIHATGGAHAAVENAVGIGRAIAARLKEAGVQGVILTST